MMRHDLCTNIDMPLVHRVDQLSFVVSCKEKKKKIEITAISEIKHGLPNLKSIPPYFKDSLSMST